MSNPGTLQAVRYNMALRRRGREFATALTDWRSGLNVVGADRYAGALTSGADFIQDATGNPWVALTSGVTGSTPLAGSSTMSDGGVTWQPWVGVIRVMPPTP